MNSLSDYDLQRFTNSLTINDVYNLSITDHRFRYIILNNVNLRNGFNKENLPYPELFSDSRDILSAYFILKKLREDNAPILNELNFKLLNELESMYLISEIINSRLYILESMFDGNVASDFDVILFEIKINNITYDIKNNLKNYVDWDEFDSCLNKCLHYSGYNIIQDIPDNYIFKIILAGGSFNPPLFLYNIKNNYYGAKYLNLYDVKKFALYLHFNYHRYTTDWGDLINKAKEYYKLTHKQ